MPSDDPTRNLTPPRSVPGVVDVHWVGAPSDPEHPPDLLVEVPHGADRRAHYDALVAQLSGTYPPGLHAFFHVNTDVGAWQLGLRVAERVVEAHPDARVVLLRCLVPRTFIDCNRVADAPASGDLAGRGVTGAMPPYVREAADQALLAELHASYVSIAEAAYDWVCGGGGFALNPHTYGPRTLAVSAITDQIVADLRRAHQPEIYDASPERPPVDLIMRTAEGEYLGPAGAEEALIEAFAAHDLPAAVSETYALLPVTQGYRFSSAHPGRVIGLEVRRDLLVEAWIPFEEQVVDPAKVDRAARPLAQVLSGLVRGGSL